MSPSAAPAGKATVARNEARQAKAAARPARLRLLVVMTLSVLRFSNFYFEFWEKLAPGRRGKSYMTKMSTRTNIQRLHHSWQAIDR
jgi:hypothetical protein